MARAIRYQMDRAELRNQNKPARSKGGVEENEARARAIASGAAKRAARKAPTRIRKSSAKRVEEVVMGRAKRSDLTPEALPPLARAGRNAMHSVKTRTIAPKPEEVLTEDEDF